MLLGYCTNVHAGADLPQTRAQLERYAFAVRKLFAPQERMGIGLWLSASSASRLLAEGAGREFADWLAEGGLVPYTVNGFPFGDFHQQRVKHAVYLPSWCEQARLEYTQNLIALLHQLLPVGEVGSISTLPIAWGNPTLSKDALQAAARNLALVADSLRQLEAETGRLIHLCLEPEPGCVFQRSTDIVNFFENELFPGRDEACLRRYLRICHDVCHAVVMFEEQREVLARYRRAGLLVGKVQVSSAVMLPGLQADPDQRRAGLAQLRTFVEERYLHQTMVRSSAHEEPRFYEDLPLALAQEADAPSDWRVHFHVPIYLAQFGQLQASQADILTCLHELRTAHAETQAETHYEVETYAWGVLPSDLQQPDLAQGIAQELRWLQANLRALASSSANPPQTTPRN